MGGPSDQIGMENGGFTRLFIKTNGISIHVWGSISLNCIEYYCFCYTVTKLSDAVSTHSIYSEWVVTNNTGQQILYQFFKSVIKVNFSRLGFCADLKYVLVFSLAYPVLIIIIILIMILMTIKCHSST